MVADGRTGGCSYDDFDDLKEAMEPHKGNVPGPMTMVSADVIVSLEQIAFAKAKGCDAVVLSLDVLDVDTVREFGDVARDKVGIDVVVQCGSEAQVDEAVGIGSDIIMIKLPESTCDVEDVVGIKERCIDAKVRDDYKPTTIAYVHPGKSEDSDTSPTTVSWTYRSAGFNAVYASEALYENGQDECEHAGAVVKSMRSKSSVKFASGRVKSGKGEGAREYLGEISI